MLSAAGPSQWRRFARELLSVLTLTTVLIAADVGYLNTTVRWFSRDLVFEAGWPKTIIFLGVYAGLSVTLAVLLLWRWTGRLAFTVATFFCALNAVYMAVNNEPFGMLDVETLFRAYGDGPQAIAAFWGQAAPAGCKALFVFGTGVWLARRWIPPISARWLALAALGIAAGLTLTVRTGGSHVRALPRCASPALVVFQMALNRPYLGPRDEPYFPPRDPPRVKHVIFIVDESVRADLLQINGHGVHNTPWLHAHRQEYLNFGVASSFTNSSSTSNLAMLTGLSLDLFPDEGQLRFRLPQIFAYARQAGAHDVWLWGQSSFGPQQRQIQATLKVDIPGENPELEHPMIDRKMIDYLLHITAEHPTSFSWLNKEGCHFNYDSAYPAARAFWKPTFDPANPQRDAMLNSYFNAVHWAVDGFLAELLTRLEGRDAIIVYTSDHGQSIMEAGVVGTHNRTFGIPSSQASVPILVFGTNPRTRQLLREHFPSENVGKTSAEQLFPTLLWLLGYHRDDIRTFYPQSLFEPLRERTRIFVSGGLSKPIPSVINTFVPPEPPVPEGVIAAPSGSGL